MKYDPEFLKSLGDTPLNEIASRYGVECAEATRAYFIKHPSDRFNKIVSLYNTKAVDRIYNKSGEKNE